MKEVHPLITFLLGMALAGTFAVLMHRQTRDAPPCRYGAVPTMVTESNQPRIVCAAPPPPPPAPLVPSEAACAPFVAAVRIRLVTCIELAGLTWATLRACQQHESEVADELRHTVAPPLLPREYCR